MATQNNFKCPKTGEEFFVPQYSYSFENGERVYLERGRPLVNPKNNEPLEMIEQKVDGFPSLGKYSMQNREGRVKSIKDRTKKHNASKKEEWHTINREGKS